MDWFGGRLEITLKAGRKETHHDLSFKRAANYCEVFANEIASAMYFPYPTSITP